MVHSGPGQPAQARAQRPHPEHSEATAETPNPPRLGGSRGALSCLGRSLPAVQTPCRLRPSPCLREHRCRIRSAHLWLQSTSASSQSTARPLHHRALRGTRPACVRPPNEAESAGIGAAHAVPAGSEFSASAPAGPCLKLHALGLKSGGSRSALSFHRLPIAGRTNALAK